MVTKKAVATVIGNVSNDAAATIDFSKPYIARVEITGTAPILWHRWSTDAVAAKAAAAKNSAAKKTDDIESYVYRCDNGNLGFPGEYLRQSVIGAARFRQDPRSPRKGAQDLYKAAVVSLTDLSDLGVADWDYLNRRRVVVQRNAVTRARPAIREGWKANVDFLILLPEYVRPADLLDVLTNAGRLVGVADFRPTFGRYAVTKFEVDEQ